MSDELKAGRELDALVAERVMGWTVNRTNDRHWHTVGPTGRERHILIGRDCCAGQHDYDSHAFMPSTDIASAWLVVEKLNATGWLCDLFRNQMMTHWHVAFAKDHTDSFVNDASAPLAVCLAALKAVGGGPRP